MTLLYIGKEKSVPHLGGEVIRSHFVEVDPTKRSLSIVRWWTEKAPISYKGLKLGVSKCSRVGFARPSLDV